MQQTNDTEGLPGESEAALPSPVSAATTCRPDPDEVLQTKHHDHHKLLQFTQNIHQQQCLYNKCHINVCTLCLCDI